MKKKSILRWMMVGTILLTMLAVGLSSTSVAYADTNIYCTNAKVKALNSTAAYLEVTWKGAVRGRGQVDGAYLVVPNADEEGKPVVYPLFNVDTDFQRNWTGYWFMDLEDGVYPGIWLFMVSGDTSCKTRLNTVYVGYPYNK